MTLGPARDTPSLDAHVDSHPSAVRSDPPVPALRVPIARSRAPIALTLTTLHGGSGLRWRHRARASVGPPRDSSFARDPSPIDQRAPCRMPIRSNRLRPSRISPHAPRPAPGTPSAHPPASKNSTQPNRFTVRQVGTPRRDRTVSSSTGRALPFADALTARRLDEHRRGAPSSPDPRRVDPAPLKRASPTNILSTPALCQRLRRSVRRRTYRAALASISPASHALKLCACTPPTARDAVDRSAAPPRASPRRTPTDRIPPFDSAAVSQSSLYAAEPGPPLVLRDCSPRRSPLAAAN